MNRPKITFYNTLTHREEVFAPLDPPHVYMYNCGPTVYDYAHIGNFKTFLFADVLRRFLELVGYDVKQVMNLTDVGHMTEDDLADGGGQDKMEQAAKRLKEAKKAGKLPAEVDLDANDPYAVAKFYTAAFVEDAKLLGMKIADEYPAQMPKATDHVADMQAMVKQLIEKDHAYVADDGAVYFSVQSFPEYGKLSGNTLENLRGGAGGRIQDTHQQSKRHPADFLLWKPDDSHLMKWDSPWGAGYPGWHIECSAMAKALLGRDAIDIHTGGEDNIFPHHECEIAQSRGATGQDRFATMWMHSRHLMVEGKKMSKSKGNFFTVRDVLSGKITGSNVDPAVLRFALIRGHYRANNDISNKGIQDSARAVRKIRQYFSQSKVILKESNPGMKDSEIKPSVSDYVDQEDVQKFIRFLAKDLNISGALGVVFDFVNRADTDSKTALGVLNVFDQVLNIIGSERFLVDQRVGDTSFTMGTVDLEIRTKCAELDAAREMKDFAKADTLRAEIIEAGYDVKTTPDGTVATKKLA